MTKYYCLIFCKICFKKIYMATEVPIEVKNSDVFKDWLSYKLKENECCNECLNFDKVVGFSLEVDND